MRISKAYWIWGQFSLKDTIYLNSIKNNVQLFLKSPRFDVHLTLCGPYKKMNSEFLYNLNHICKKNRSIILNLEIFDFCDKKYKSFFIKTNTSIELNHLRNSIYEVSKFDRKKKFQPHISLAYGNHKRCHKNLLISKIPSLRSEITLSKISLVYVNEEISNWKILHSYKLRKK